jgi:hypothetical protein
VGKKVVFVVEYDDYFTVDRELKEEIIKLMGVRSVEQFKNAEQLTVDENSEQCSNCPANLCMEATD